VQGTAGYPPFRQHQKQQQHDLVRFIREKNASDKANSPDDRNQPTPTGDSKKRMLAAVDLYGCCRHHWREPKPKGRPESEQVPVHQPISMCKKRRQVGALNTTIFSLLLKKEKEGMYLYIFPSQYTFKK
jgi:hypothetical protein